MVYPRRGAASMRSRDRRSAADFGGRRANNRLRSRTLGEAPIGTAPSRFPAWPLTAAVIAVTIAAHIRFILVDTRVPRDLGLYYGGVPHAYDLLLGRTPGALSEWWQTIGQSSGWYHLLLAAVLAIFGRGQDTFQVPDVLWVASVLTLTGLITRRIAGARAALVAVTLTAAMPGLIVSGRTGWLHVPEAALALAGVWTWMGDPGLTRRGTGVTLAVLGLLELALRPSGLVWYGSLGPAASLGGRGGDADRLGRGQRRSAALFKEVSVTQV